jgi:prepilin-type N-terminal cleavage/methylation domain-containing protein
MLKRLKGNGAAPPSRHPRRRGFTLLEVMIAMAIATVATSILSTSVTSLLANTMTRQQRTIAAEGAMNCLEQIRSTPAELVFALFNSDPSDDPDGEGTGFGPLFSIEGLDPVLDNAGNPLPIGTVLLPGNGAVLDESFDQPEFGLPRDLDGDLMVSAGDCSDCYLVLPVTVRIRWQSRLGERSLEMSVLLVDMEKLTL